MKTRGFFLLRRPLLSNEILFGFQHAASNNPDLFEYHLKLIYSDARLQQALLLASPAMHEQLIRFLDNKLESGKEKVLQTLFKYLIRMSTRCTPFGLFAGCSLGTVTDQTKFKFASKDHLVLHTRLDSECLMNVCDTMLKKETVLNQARFYPNTSLYPVMDTYRYVERLTDSANRFMLSAVKKSRYLNLVLEHAKNGLQIGELIALLTQHKISKKQAAAFIKSLVGAQILVSSFALNAAGEDYLTRLKRELEGIKGCEPEFDRLNSIDELLKQDTNPVSTYQKLKSVLELPGGSIKTMDLLQTDTYFKTDHCELSQAALDVITGEISQLLPLSCKTESPDLKNFARKLFQRFGSRELPLLVALDEATGIGFGSLNPTGVSELPLLEDLTSAFETENESKSGSALKILQKTILEKAKNGKLKSIELTCDHIALGSESEPKTMPESFYILGSIMAGSRSEIDRGIFKFDLKAMAGPSGLNLMARFAGGSQDLETRLQKAAEKEQSLYPDLILAEICHLPDARSLNVIKRPKLHQYEIPYLSTSCLAPAFQIQPSELMVYSPDGVQIILTCPRLGKRIIPRLTSAHNYSSGLPFYRFLCELAQQTGGAYLNWDWQEPLNKPFYPRITYKHLILKKASWHLDGEIHEKLTGNTDAVLNAWENICQQFAIPRYVQIQLGDNELLIDGQCIFSLQLLCSYLKKTSKLILIEYLGTESSGFLTQGGKSLDHEIIVPFLNSEIQKEIKSHVISDISEPVIYNLGSEWLYVKIYCSAQSADYLLTKIISPFCTRLMDQGLIQKWFYIRYFDPKGHLRIRLNLIKKEGIWSSVLRKFQAALDPVLSSGLVTALKTDSYVRELERYQFLAYAKLETLFSMDSICTSNCLALLSEQTDPDLKWLLALKGCDQLLDDLGLNECEKSKVIKELYNQFTNEFAKNPRDKVTLDKKYRKFKPLIVSFLSPASNNQQDIEKFKYYFDRRSLGIRQTMANADKLSGKAPEELAANLVHLFLNRWFHTEQRRQEWVLYHFLKKFYDSILNFPKMRKN